MLPSKSFFYSRFGAEKHFFVTSLVCVWYGITKMLEIQYFYPTESELLKEKGIGNILKKVLSVI